MAYSKTPPTLPVHVALARAVAKSLGDERLQAPLIALGLKEWKEKGALSMETVKGWGTLGYAALVPLWQASREVTLNYNEIRALKARKSPQTDPEVNLTMRLKDPKLCLPCLSYMIESRHQDTVASLALHPEQVATLKHQLTQSAVRFGNWPALSALAQTPADKESALMLCAQLAQHEGVAALLPDAKLGLKSAAKLGLVACVKGNAEILEVIGRHFSADPAALQKLVPVWELAMDQSNEIQATLKALGSKKAVTKPDPNWGDFVPDGLKDVKRGPVTYPALREISNCIASEGYDRATANQYAHTFLTLLDNSPTKVLEFMRQNAIREKQPLHDCVSTAVLPDTIRQPKAWQEGLMKFGKPLMALVGLADRMEPAATLAQTREQAALLKYARGQEHPSLAAFCSSLDIPEKSFNEALKLVAARAKHPPGESRIPDVTVEADGFRLSRLPPGDPTGLFLGAATDCCQSLGGVGAACAKHGFSSENGGFYVVHRGQELVGQTWAWRGKKGEMCLDSLEFLGNRMDADSWNKLLAALADKLTPTDVTRLTVGTSGKTPTELASIDTKAATPLGYTGYRDSKSQLVVWQSPAITKAPPKVEVSVS